MNQDDIAKTAQLLAQLEPGFLPYPIFEQVARLVVLPILEFIPLRRRDGAIEVLLIAREADDPFWPGMLHTPGTVVRATDLNESAETNWPAFERIIQDELKGTTVGSPQYVGSQFRRSKRGIEQAQLYWVEVIGEPKIGSFYAIDKLPADLIEAQRGFIEEAVRHYKTAS